MYFKLRRDARDFFKDIKNDIEVDFDIYYWCLIYGFAAQRRDPDFNKKDATDLIDNFPALYSSNSRLIIALLIRDELRNLGIRLSDRDEVRKRINKLLNSQTPSALSDEGIGIMNQISSGGYDLLTTTLADRPRTMAGFILDYAKQTKEAIQKLEW